MPTPIRSADQIRAVLTDLGNTADAVAHTLHTLGFAGDLASSDSCPVARYLSAYTPVTFVQVTDHEVTVDLDDGSTVTVFNPPAVTEFILRFDLRGMYPHLIASPQPTTPADPDTFTGTEAL